jgi:hypothetical protein
MVVMDVLKLFYQSVPEASMGMLMRFSLSEHAHETSMSMLIELSCACAHEACMPTTTLGKSAAIIRLTQL